MTSLSWIFNWEQLRLVKHCERMNVQWILLFILYQKIYIIGDKRTRHAAAAAPVHCLLLALYLILGRNRGRPRPWTLLVLCYLAYRSIVKAMIVRIETYRINSDITVLKSQPDSPKSHGYCLHITYSSIGIAI